MSARDLKPGYDFRNSIAAFRLSPCCTFRSLLLFSSCKTTKEGKKNIQGPRNFPPEATEKKVGIRYSVREGAKKYVFMASGKERERERERKKKNEDAAESICRYHKKARRGRERKPLHANLVNYFRLRPSVMNINKCIYSSSLYVTTVEAPFHLFPQILGINVVKKYAALLRAHAIYTPAGKGPLCGIGTYGIVRIGLERGPKYRG